MKQRDPHIDPITLDTDVTERPGEWKPGDITRRINHIAPGLLEYLDGFSAGRSEAMGLTIVKDLKESLELLQEANRGLRAKIEQLDRQKAALQRELTLERNEVAELRQHLWGSAPEGVKNAKG